MYKNKSKFPEFNLTALVSLNPENPFLDITNETYINKWLVFFFYPMDFTFVCPTEIIEFDKLNDQFQKSNSQILGCSVDSEYTHFGWRKFNKDLINISIPLLSDKGRELSTKLDILNSNGVSDRATFIIDPDGYIRFSMVTDISVGRNPREVLRILHALQSGALCRADWQNENDSIDPIKEMNK